MIRNTATCYATLALLAMSHAAIAADPGSVSKGKSTSLGLYLTAVEAHERMVSAGAKTLFIDVRSRAEVQFVGIPTDADANVPYQDFTDFSEFDEQHGSYRLDYNPGFVQDVARRLAAKGLSKSDVVIVLCRSGSRSAKAADTLAKAGFTNVYSVVDGFEGDTAKSGPDKGHRTVNGWKNAHLPWTYKLTKAQLARTDF